MLKTCSRPVQRNPPNLTRKSPRQEILVESHEIRGNPKLIGSRIGPLKRQKPWGGRGGLHLNCQQLAGQVTFTLTNSPTVPALPYTAPNTLILCHALMYCTGLLTAFCNSRSRTAVNSLACKRVISGVPHRLRQHYFAVTFIFCAADNLRGKTGKLRKVEPLKLQ